ncbi:hypothetical protein D3C86_1497400 [compost metagenome]
MVQVRLHVQADAVEADPFADLDADGGDLVFAGPARALALDPYADTALAHSSLDAELIQSADDPVFQTMHEGAHVLAAPIQVQHDIGHALARPVIGELPAPPRAVDRETVGGQQVVVLGRDARRIEGRMLQQPDHLLGLARRDGGDAGLHGGDGGLIVDIAGRDRPFDGTTVGADQRWLGDT